ncbi:hypothetical protein QZH41_002321 [Actinostola sp. cb2023]|nr:hypothetical protein QZH41_002321 [Actinostola sp. cb2023]
MVTCVGNTTVIPQYLPHTITSLVIVHKEVQKLGPSSFARYDKLERIYLQGNPIEIIEEDAFVGLRRVRTLNLTNLKLKKIKSGAFRGMSSLSRLYLQGNEKLVRLPLDIFDPINLQFLSPPWMLDAFSWDNLHYYVHGWDSQVPYR